MTLLAALGFMAVNAADITKKDEIKSDETWTKSNTYFLDGFVLVTNGATLTIEAGTVIKGLAADNITSGDAAAALIIGRGAKIMAEGTATEPIIFTSELDDVNDANDLNLSDPNESRSLWGGLVLLGNAPIGSTASEIVVEGLPNEDRYKFGGTNAADNSGVLRFISIRHSGYEIAADSELQGLSLGGVGSGTTIEYVESFFSGDDGVEFFGGTVDVRYWVSSFNDDDGLDWDEGYRGRIQFALVIGDSKRGDHGAECDGAKPDDNALYSAPQVYNVTFIGGYENATNSGAKNEHGMVLRDGTGGVIANSIITEYNNYALQVEDRAETFDSYSKMKNGDLEFINNYWYSFGAGSSWNDIILATPEKARETDAASLKTHLANNNNTIANPGITSTSRTSNFNPTLKSGSATLTGGKPLVDDEWFYNVPFIGAFNGETDECWIKGWTAMDHHGMLASGLTYGGITSIENANLKYFGVYPNPANEVVYVDLNLEVSENVQVRLLDLSGRVVMNVASGSMEGISKLTINTENLNKGTYFIQINGVRTALTQRLMLQ